MSQNNVMVRGRQIVEPQSTSNPRLHTPFQCDVTPDGVPETATEVSLMVSARNWFNQKDWRKLLNTMRAMPLHIRRKTEMQLNLQLKDLEDILLGGLSTTPPAQATSAWSAPPIINANTPPMPSVAPPFVPQPEQCLVVKTQIAPSNAEEAAFLTKTTEALKNSDWYVLLNLYDAMPAALTKTVSGAIGLPREELVKRVAQLRSTTEPAIIRAGDLKGNPVPVAPVFMHQSPSTTAKKEDHTQLTLTMTCDEIFTLNLALHMSLKQTTANGHQNHVWYPKMLDVKRKIDTHVNRLNQEHGF